MTPDQEVALADLRERLRILGPKVSGVVLKRKHVEALLAGIDAARKGEEEARQSALFREARCSRVGCAHGQDVHDRHDEATNVTTACACCSCKGYVGAGAGSPEERGA